MNRLLRQNVRVAKVEQLEAMLRVRVAVGAAFGLSKAGEADVLLITAELRKREHLRRVEQQDSGRQWA